MAKMQHLAPASRHGSSSGLHPDIVGDSNSLPISDLPYEVLVDLSMYVPAKDIVKGLSQTDRRLREVFMEERYWEERLRRTWPQLHRSSQRDSGIISSLSGQYWMKRAFKSERIQESFGLTRLAVRKKVYNISHDQTLQLDEDFAMVDFTCMAFCDGGKTLVVAESHNGWLLHWDLQKEFWQAGRKTINDVHESVITSIRVQNECVSTASLDCSVTITDLHKPLQAVRRLLSHDNEEFYSHAWMDNLIVGGNRSGTLELFDLRTPDGWILGQNTDFEHISFFDGNEVEMMDGYVLAAGWMATHRVIKQFDLRKRAFSAEATVPQITFQPLGGHWGANVRHKAVTSLSSDGQFFIGAEGGRVFEYDAKSLSLVQDHSNALGHPTHLAGIHCTDGHIISLSRAGRGGQPPTSHRVAVHALRTRAELVWEYLIPSIKGTLPVMAFSSQRCALAVALSDSVFLWQT